MTIQSVLPPASTYHASDGAAYEIFLGRWTYITALADGLRRRIEDAVRRAYYSGSPDGERSLTATAWAVRGTVA